VRPAHRRLRRMLQRCNAATLQRCTLQRCNRCTLHPAPCTLPLQPTTPSRMPRDPVKRKASREAYEQSDKGKARAQRYDQSDKGKAKAQRYKQSDKGKAKAQRYDQSDKGKAAKQAAAQRAASANASAASFLTGLKKLPHAQRVKDYFSEAELGVGAASRA
jgi:hypothetical protein